MKRVFLAFVAMFAMTTTPAHAERKLVEAESLHIEKHERVRVLQGGQMQYGQRYNGISQGHRGLVAINFSFGGGGGSGYRVRDYRPVRRYEVGPGTCVIRVQAKRPAKNKQAEIDLMTKRCLAVARRQGDRNPQVVVDFF